MRPVRRVDRPESYSTDIRLDSQDVLDGDLHQTWYFTSKSVREYYGTSNPQIGWTLYEYLSLANGEPPPPEFKEIKGTLDGRIGDTYRKASTGLAQAYGTFCSYCEQYLPGEIDVEHCAPKSPYPLFCLSWENFLLACSACNGKAGKTDKPARDEVATWQPYDYEVDRYWAIRQHYVWPDTPTAYLDIYPHLHVQDPESELWWPVADNEAVWIGMTVVDQDVASREIYADMIYCDEPVRLRVAVLLRSATDDGKGDESIDFYGLNHFGNTDNVADRRVYNRTLAWFRVVQYFAPLVVEFSPRTFNMVWPLILQAVPTVGFFSVWVRVLELMFGTDTEVPVEEGTGPTLMDQFLADTTGPNAAFPNTDIDCVPYPR